jgi:hypothetical protein
MPVLWLLLNRMHRSNDENLCEIIHSLKLPWLLRDWYIPFLCDAENWLSTTVTARSKAWTVLSRSNAGIVGSNPTESMDVSVHLLCVCIDLCIGNGLATLWSPSMDFCRLCIRSRNWKSGQGQTKDCRAIDRQLFPLVPGTARPFDLLNLFVGRFL